MMPKEKLRRADIVTSTLLAMLGIAVIVGACRMPMTGTYGGRPVHWYTSPAFSPMLLGSLLVVCSIGIFLRAVRDGGHRGLAPAFAYRLKTLPKNRVAHRILAIWALLAGYILCLSFHPFGGLSGPLERLALGNSSFTAFLLEPEGINYVLSSFLFLVTFMLAFYRASDAASRRSSRLMCLSLLVSWGVGYIFTQHLYTPLPW